MSAILPNSIVHLFKGVPLEEGYDDTFYFDRTNAYGQGAETAQDQASWFLNTYQYGKRTFTALTYVKPNENRIRIEATADSLRDYNYMMFQNTNYGSKWFYAFITKIEYVNNAVTEIEFKIDAIQTWYFDIRFEYSFVDREHSSTDGFGENVVEENICFGDLLVSNKKDELFEEKEVGGTYQPMYTAVVYYIPKYKVLEPTHQPHRGDYTGDPVKLPIKWYWTKNTDWYDYSGSQQQDALMIPWKGTIANGIFMGTTYYGIPFDVRKIQSYSDASYTLTYLDDTRNKLVSLIDFLIELDCDIVNITLIPTDIWYSEITAGSTYSKNSYINESDTFIDGIKTRTYTPKNNKMYCYPYKRIIVSNNTGNTSEFRWENCKRSAGVKRFNYLLRGTVLPSTEVTLLPSAYRGIDTSDFESGIPLNDFPQVSWTVDSFKQWWAQNRDSFTIGMLSTAVMNCFSVGTSNVSAQNSIATAKPAMQEGVRSVQGARLSLAGVGAINDVVQASLPYVKASNMPNQMYGNAGCSALKTALNRIGYTIYEMSINADSAEAIDNYFTMFGYACKKVKLPNLYGGGNIRENWNYIKTNGAKIHGMSQLNTDNIGLTSEDLKEIVAIFDHGITFWNREIDIGNYNHTNNPVSP